MIVQRMIKPPTVPQTMAMRRFWFPPGPLPSWGAGFILIIGRAETTLEKREKMARGNKGCCGCLEGMVDG
jgi:hypothetical protein